MFQVVIRKILINWVINVIILLQYISYQSKSREYIVFAKPSRLTAALWGSRLRFITSSGVIMTRLHNASSRASALHLKKIKIQSFQVPTKWMGTYQNIYELLQQNSYMRSSAVILRWNLALSSFGTDESISFPLANSIFPRWSIAATTLKIASWERAREKSEGGPSYLNVTNKLKLSLKRMNLFLVTYPNNFHCSPCGKIIMCITYTNQVIAIWLVKIVKWFRVSQLVLLNFLLTLTTLDEFSNEVR